MFKLGLAIMTSKRDFNRGVTKLSGRSVRRKWFVDGELGRKRLAFVPYPNEADRPSEEEWLPEGNGEIRNWCLSVLYK